MTALDHSALQDEVSNTNEELGTTKQKSSYLISWDSDSEWTSNHLARPHTLPVEKRGTVRNRFFTGMGEDDINNREMNTASVDGAKPVQWSTNNTAKLATEKAAAPGPLHLAVPATLTDDWTPYGLLDRSTGPFSTPFRRVPPSPASFRSHRHAADSKRPCGYLHELARRPRGTGQSPETALPEASDHFTNSGTGSLGDLLLAVDRYRERNGWLLTRLREAEKTISLLKAELEQANQANEKLLDALADERSGSEKDSKGDGESDGKNASEIQCDSASDSDSASGIEASASIPLPASAETQIDNTSPRVDFSELSRIMLAMRERIAGLKERMQASAEKKRKILSSLDETLGESSD
ncbi:hypothetical protein MBLNU459_g3296t1 [Dothideomycetes sp. NU459]